ncbi:RagB/SusD family nutrient uptake outer membrane protein [Pedobacter sp. BMA]|uniref:RagB/SusD family nutrient uptake outer membrane protein n=1 Tax=Pedobacter sp. BMA TaxID=1663685 RepID=UPI000649A994|nr:RagB/SusD family nutrient uptake outer membrane protein [Pedobacter sp. BMA]KLT67336.1 glycan metabolism protein RagB [Pedobacter sp. BMA]
MKKINYIILAIAMFNIFSCRKYVEIPPEQTKALSTTVDYMQLMNNSFSNEQSYYYPVFSGDDCGTTETTWQNTLTVPAGNAYIWADRFYGANEEDLDWQTNYKKIFIWNTVIEGIMGSSGAEADKQLGLSYALVNRAYDYFTLVNLYGKQYDGATAATDPAVPLILQPKFLTDLSRASVQNVYDQIENDLLAAIPNLKDLPDYNTNPSKVGAYGLLARVYLHKRDFIQAQRYADLALALKNTLLDLNVFKVPTATFPTKTFNPEELMVKRTIQYPSGFPLSADAESIYDKSKDLRYTYLTAPGANVRFSNFTVARAYNKSVLTGDGGYVGPSVPEMILIKAECQARAGNTAATLTLLNDFRKKRFDNATTYVNLTAANANEALRLVIDERKREFVGRGFRWFDQRRLNKDSGFISTVTRVFKGNTYTLEPGGNRYVYAIADKYITLNPEITQNPR